MRRAAVVLALLVGACAGSRGPAPAPTAGLDWWFHPDGGSGRLTYGAPESDEVLLQLDCRKAAGRLAVSLPASEQAPHELKLIAGDRDAVLPAEAVPAQTHEGVDLVAQAPLDAPVFQAFRRSGWLGVKVDGKVRTLVAQPGGEAVERFFAFCSA